MKIYDSRMNPWDNFLYKLWYPAICWVRGHNWWCAGVANDFSLPIENFFWMCKRCAAMHDSKFTCGMCTNACRYKRRIDE